MPGLASVGGCTGLKVKEVGFFYFAPALVFHGVIKNRSAIINGGYNNYVEGKHIYVSIGGSGNRSIYIKALTSGTVSVYKCDIRDSPPTLLVKKTVQSDEMVYSGEMPSEYYFLVEIQ